MRKYVLVLAGLLSLLSPAAQAANSTVSAMTAASALGGTELFYVVQGAADRKATPAQINTYILSLMGTGVGTALGINVGTAGSFIVNGGALGTPSSGTATNLSGTAASLTAGNVTTNANLTGMVTSVGNAASLGSFSSANLLAALTTKTGTGSAVFGSAPTIDSLNATTAATLAFITGSTQCLQVNTSGVISGTGAVCGGAGSTGANPTATASDTAVNGVASTFMRSDGAPAIQKTSSSVFGLAKVDGTTITATAGVISAVAGGTGTVTTITPGAGQVSSVTAACSQSNITVTGTLSTAECVNAQSGTSYAIVDGDRGKLVTGTNAAAQAYSIAQAGAVSAFQTGWFTRVQNKGTLTLTITPATSTINGAATYVLYPNQTVKITSDGTNYQVDAGASGTVAVNSQTGTNYPIVSSDFSKLVNLSNASNQVPTLPTAATVGASWFATVCNQGAGTQTITPTTSTIGGAASYVLRAASAAAPVCIAVVSDGTNYQVVPDAGLGTLSGAVKASGGQLSQAACADLSNGTALCSTTPGTGVAAAAAASLSAAGGLTSTIASGTSALGTTAIGSAACATVVTTAATNTATTDVVSASFNGDPTAVTGYVPLTSGMLTIIAYPTSGNVNFKVCNNTSGSITPGAITLNWRVLR